ncbi:unnamed protein product [Cuscuta campestris]|uniref:1-phosphatidylinositol-3-phosphate 5-kinase n=1 Tax=Cuscuta campestris TaxID=132261 RepID=A0A484L3G1_9ASTE|nr:unnamed protein product [Cuscuta campestris]
MEEENENCRRLNDINSIQSCQFCGEMTDGMYIDSTSQGATSISPTVSFESTERSVSSCSDFSVDVNSDCRGFLDESTTGSSPGCFCFNVNGDLPDSRLQTPSNGSNVDYCGINNRGSEVENSISERDPDEESGVCFNLEVDADFWRPPDPVDRDLDMEGSVTNYEDDEDIECADGLNLVSFGEEVSGSVKFKEQKRKAMEEVMSGKFKALVTQLLKSVGVNSTEEDVHSWVDIVTGLSWNAASFVKVVAAKGKAMDPDGYVKVKCVATGTRNQCQFVKGLVFKKHAAHKHMPSRYKNPRLLLIRGALGLSSNELSSFESMQQEKDDLKSFEEMLEKYHPNVVLVEKAVSRDVQESILKKGITLVFDMKLHRLERVARCTGSPILSCDSFAAGKLRQCDSFHFEKFIEEHATSREGGRRPNKTLMFIEGCPTRLGCTILLMGSNIDELKRIKCVVQCAVVMAYHLILETSFILDQRAMFSTVQPTHLMTVSANKKNSTSVSHGAESVSNNEDSLPGITDVISNGFHAEGDDILQSEVNPEMSLDPYNPIILSGFSALTSSLREVMIESFPKVSSSHQSMCSHLGVDRSIMDDHIQTDAQVSNASTVVNSVKEPKIFPDEEKIPEKEIMHISDTLEEDLDAENELYKDQRNGGDDITTVLDSESILVLMSSRNASKGIMCEHRHFSHIRFYKNFDVPLGNFLQDTLLNQLLCKTCAEPPNVHIFYYAHYNKQLTIQVRACPADWCLSGAREGKLWMWSRCGKCKLKNGSSKSTKRILISSAARGLSFGKFLELTFSNSSVFNKLSNCGHCLHRDFALFFGLGPMVAMLRYTPVATYLVSLPPLHLEFGNPLIAEFLNRDIENVYSKGIQMFKDIKNTLKDIWIHSIGRDLNLQETPKEFIEIDAMLKEERSHFEADIEKLNNGNVDNIAYKFLSLNTIRLDLLLEACIWDKRLHALLSFAEDIIKQIYPQVDNMEHGKTCLRQDEKFGKEVSHFETDIERVDTIADSGAEIKIEFDGSVEDESNVVEIFVEGPADDASGNASSLDMNITDTHDRENYLGEQLEGLMSEDDSSSSSSVILEGSKGLIAGSASRNNLPVRGTQVKSNFSSKSHAGDAGHLEHILPSSTQAQINKLMPATSDAGWNHFEDNSFISMLSSCEAGMEWIWTPFPEIRCEFIKILKTGNLPKFGSVTCHAAESILSGLIADEGAKLHIPLGDYNYIISDFEDELSSIIACALALLKDLPPNTVYDFGDDDREDKVMDAKTFDSSQGLMRAFLFSQNSSSRSLDSEGSRSSVLLEESCASSFDGLDSFNPSVHHVQVNMGYGKHQGKRKYHVSCAYASQFRQLRDRCCTSEDDYIASISRCRVWDAKGGKSKSLFAKTFDDRFIIKGIQKIEYDSFMVFGPDYFKYLDQCYEKGNQTCLAKILGVYQVTIRPTKNGKEKKYELMVMENLSFGRVITRQYDLKGALHARFNTPSNEAGNVLLDQNFVNDMNDSPLYVTRKSKQNLQRAVWNDCSFLNHINVMDYSLLVGMDTQRRELVCGIIDYLRQYTWGKHIETFVKSSVLIPKNQSPTVISPKEYKKRFRKFIDTHFLSVPDHWCSQRSSKPCQLCQGHGRS